MSALIFGNVHMSRQVNSISSEKAWGCLHPRCYFIFSHQLCFMLSQKLKSPVLKVHFGNYQFHVEPARMKLILDKSTCEIEALKHFPWSSSSRARRQGTSHFLFTSNKQRGSSLFFSKENNYLNKKNSIFPPLRRFSDNLVFEFIRGFPIVNFHVGLHWQKSRNVVFRFWS